MKTLRLDDVDLARKFKSKDEYESALKEVQLRLLKLQIADFNEQRRSIIVFEGWDAAGKGGAIRRLTEKLDPRGVKVWPIGAPREEEQSRHYLYRFWEKIPAPGTWAVFDRSWYGRVLVERVEKFAKKKAWQRAYSEINAFEKMLFDDGVTIVKIFVHISKKEQLRRFHEREADPYKRWKIGPDDWRNRKKWSSYETAIADMFAETSSRDCPWTIVAGEHKWRGRVESCRIIAQALEKAR